MDDKPKQWSAEYGSIFQDESVVAAYQFRPTYPPETFTFLLRLIPQLSRTAWFSMLDVERALLRARLRPWSIKLMLLIFPQQ